MKGSPAAHTKAGQHLCSCSVEVKGNTNMFMYTVQAVFSLYSCYPPLTTQGVALNTQLLLMGRHVQRVGQPL